MRGAVPVATGSAAWALVAPARVAAARPAGVRLPAARVAGGLVPVAVVPRVRPGRVAAARLADVLGVGRPGGPGPLARAAAWPGVAAGTVAVSRVVRLAPAVSAVLAVRRSAHHLGRRGGVVIRGAGGRIRRGVAVGAGCTPAGPAGDVPVPGRVLAVPGPERGPPVDRPALSQREGRAGQRVLLGAARPPPPRRVARLARLAGGSAGRAAGAGRAGAGRAGARRGGAHGLRRSRRRRGLLGRLGGTGEGLRGRLSRRRRHALDRLGRRVRGLN